MYKFNESSYNYLNSFCLSWEDISWAYVKGLIDVPFLEYYINLSLDDDTSIEMYLNFNANEDFKVTQRLHEIYVELGPISKNNIKALWLYLILKYLYMRKCDDEAFTIIEEVYADFDYPEIIETFVRYMPIKPEDALIRDKQVSPIQRLRNNWAVYLENFERLHPDIVRD